MRHLHRVILILLLVHGVGAYAAQIGVSPVLVNLDRVNDRAAVTVVNSGTEPVVMHVEMVEWKRTDAGDEDVPTGDMVVNPPIFTIPPGSSQVVRVGVRRNTPPQSEGSYRLILREVPSAASVDDTQNTNQLRVLMAVRVPVYVAPAKVARAAQWNATRQADGSVTASVNNDGNVHVRVNRIQFKLADGQLVPAKQTPMVVVFPGERQSFRIPGAGGGDSNLPVALELTTNDGQHVVPIKVNQL